jgi:iron(III) transport system permease protein
VVVVGLLLALSSPAWMHITHAPPAALLTTTVLGLMWAYVIRFAAIAIQTLRSAYARLPLSWDESARMLGMGKGWTLFTRVHGPLLRRPVWVALLLVFVDVMKELPATLVLRPFGHDTLAVMAYQLAKDERLTEAALPSLALVLVGLIPMLWLSRSLNDSAAAPT